MKRVTVFAALVLSALTIWNVVTAGQATPTAVPAQP